MTDVLSIPSEEFAARQEKTQRLMREKGFDALLAFSCYGEREGHVCYLCNHHISFPNVMSHMALGHAALLLPAEGLGTLVSPLSYEKDKVVGIDAALTGFDMVTDIVTAVGRKGLAEKKIGVVGMDVLPAEYYFRLTQALPKAGLANAGDILEGQRLIKSANEIALLRRAAHIADAGLLAGLEAAQPGATEHEVELAARRGALGAGADFVPRIRVASGKRCNPLGWPMSKNRQLEEGDFVYIDVIGWFANYGFDNSRVKVAGKATAEQKEVLNTVADATQWMVDVLKPGVAREFYFTAARGCSMMALAHGIGIEICENPWITLGRKFTPQPGMVLCVEPQVTSRFGSFAIEDAILFTESGVEVLNQCPRVTW